MMNENETKLRAAVGPCGTESPAKSPADVLGMSGKVEAAANAALVRQRGFARLSPEEQLRGMAAFLMYGGIGDD